MSFEEFPIPNKDDCIYTRGFCEENVWHIIRQMKMKGDADLNNFYAVFISNKYRQIMLFNQRHSSSPGGASVLDYHVILVGKQIGVSKKSYVWDLDSLLDFPTEIDVYFSQALRNEIITVPQALRRKYRIVPAQVFLSELASDRRHMKSRKDNSWLKTPPAQDCIVGEKATTTHNLNQFIDMQKPGLGIIAEDSFEFLSFFTGGGGGNNQQQ